MIQSKIKSTDLGYLSNLAFEGSAYNGWDYGTATMTDDGSENGYGTASGITSSSHTGLFTLSQFATSLSAGCTENDNDNLSGLSTDSQFAPVLTGPVYYKAYYTAAISADGTKVNITWNVLFADNKNYTVNWRGGNSTSYSYNWSIVTTDTELVTNADNSKRAKAYVHGRVYKFENGDIVDVLYDYTTPEKIFLDSKAYQNICDTIGDKIEAIIPPKLLREVVKRITCREGISQARQLIKLDKYTGTMR